MRLEHLRRIHFFVTQFGFTKNFRLELELHKFLYAFALHQNLRPLLVNRDAQLVLLCEEKRVLLWRELKTEFIEQRAKFRRLLRCQGMRERAHLASRKRSTFNFQRATFNDLLNSTPAGENIRSWTLSACHTVVLRRRVERCTFLPT